MWIAAYKLVGSLTKVGWVPLAASCMPQHSTLPVCKCSCACLAYLTRGRFGFAAFPKIPHPTNWWGSNNGPCPCKPPRSLKISGREVISAGCSFQTEAKVRHFNVKFRWPLLGCLNTEAWSAYTSHCNQWELQISTHGLQITYSSRYH